MPTDLEAIHLWMTDHRNEGISLLQRMVREASTQGNESAVQQIVAEQLEMLGFVVDMWEPGGDDLLKHPYFSSPRRTFSGSSNVVGVLKGAGGGRSIILNGHVDVVPEGDSSQWKFAPYSGKVVGEKMYGRGVTDMKGGNVSLFLAIQCLKEIGVTLKGDVILQSVVEEESGGAGTLAAILQGYKADAALIPEPTNMRIFPRQQGSMWFRLLVAGRSAHGGTRYEGVNAIEKSMQVLEHVRELEKMRNAKVDDPLYERTPIPLPINVGVIEGGKWPSSVPDLVKLEGRMGVSPGETQGQAQEQMESWMEKLYQKDAWFKEYPVTIEWFGARWLPGAIDTDHAFVRVLAEQFRRVLGNDPVLEASPWGTDGGLLTQVGGIPTVVFGPGATEVAHYPNEHIVLDNMFQTAEIVAMTLIQWCGVNDRSLIY